MTIRPATRPRRGQSPAWLPRGAGLGCAALVAGAATVAAHWLPVVGAPVIGIVAGILLSGTVSRDARVRRAIAFTSGRVLQLAVVLLGTQLSLRQVWHVGTASLPVMLGTLTACLLLAYLAGRWLGVPRDLRTLIGVGTAICGASAIAAVSPVVRAKGSDIAYAVTTIFLFNVAAVLTFPPLGHLLGLSQHGFGTFAGTAVNDTSSVVAAADSYGDAASNYAVVVKLTRMLMIIPIGLALAAITERRRCDAEQAGVRITRFVPGFLIGFVVAAAANSAGWLPASLHAPLRTASGFLITVALSVIGLSTDMRSIRRAGGRPVLLGLILWIGVAVTSLLLQALTQ